VLVTLLFIELMRLSKYSRRGTVISNDVHLLSALTKTDKRGAQGLCKTPGSRLQNGSANNGQMKSLQWPKFYKEDRYCQC
jgi:hypothetical protein